MTDGRFEAALGDAGGGARADQLCRAAATVLAAGGAALSVFLTGDVSVPVGASDEEAARADDLEFTVGDGPGRLAYRSRRPVHVHGLRPPASPALSVWPTWAREFARHTSYRSACAAPLLVGRSALGVLTLFTHDPDDHGPDQAVAAVAALITRDLLSHETLTPDDPDPAWLETPVSRRRVVWKAQGITMRAQGITARQALTLLRAHALAVGRPLVDIAQDVVQAQLLLRRPDRRPRMDHR